MKGGISLKDFIKEVKEELRSAVDNEEPFFEMGEVELEVSFSLDLEAEAKAKFFVASAGAKGAAKQSHKVKIKLTPFVIDKKIIETSLPPASKNPGSSGSRIGATGSGRGRTPTASTNPARVKKAPVAHKPMARQARKAKKASEEKT